MALAALTHPNGPAMPLTMDIKMIVNSRGEVCMLHEKRFENTPLWVKYRKAARSLEVLFDNGTTESVDLDVSDSLDSYLVNTNKVMIVLIEQQKPVEGWKTILLNELH